MKPKRKTRSEASKQAQKRYDEAHKGDVKRIDIKVNKTTYKQELAFLETLKSRQYFIMWLITEFLSNRELQEKWDREQEKSGK